MPKLDVKFEVNGLQTTVDIKHEGSAIEYKAILDAVIKCYVVDDAMWLDSEGSRMVVYFKQSGIPRNVDLLSTLDFCLNEIGVRMPSPVSVG